MKKNKKRPPVPLKGVPTGAEVLRMLRDRMEFIREVFGHGPGNRRFTCPLQARIMRCLRVAEAVVKDAKRKGMI